MVEFAILLPVLVFLLLFSFEMGRFLVRAYLPSTNIAYEGVRSGIGLSSMIEGCYDGPFKDIVYLPNPPSGGEYSNWLALKRAHVLVEQYEGTSALPVVNNSSIVNNSGGTPSTINLSQYVGRPSIDGRLIKTNPSNSCGLDSDFYNTWSVRVCGTYQPALFPNALFGFDFCAESVGSLLMGTEIFEVPGGNASYNGGSTGGGYSSGFNSFTNST